MVLNHLWEQGTEFVMRTHESAFVRVGKATVIPMMALMGTAYFAGHAVYGDYGLDAKMRLERQAESSKRTLYLVREERERLERNVALMRPDGLDPDLLEERVRATLQFAAPADIVVLTSSR